MNIAHRIMVSSIVFLGLTISLSSAVFAADKDDEEMNEKGKESIVKFKDLPKAVQNAFRRQLKGVKPSKIEMEKEDGFVEYEAKAKLGKKTMEFKVSADGKLMETEQKLALGKLPKAVSDAIHKRFPKAKMQKAERVTMTYIEVKILRDGKKEEVKLLENGRGIKIEEDE